MKFNSTTAASIVSLAFFAASTATAKNSAIKPSSSNSLRGGLVERSDKRHQYDEQQRDMQDMALRRHLATDLRIVGGEQSEPGDFPYYVGMGGCGGALIAPSVVLFAAHCRDNKDQQINIGSYKKWSDEFGAQQRFCEVWIGDPNYGGASGINNDFALCQLNKPVDISASNIKLILNEEESVPAVNEDLLVCGLGALSQGGSGPGFLHNVTVPTMSTEQCNANGWYNGGVTDQMLCAGFTDGGKDSCQGDSGGPIVRRKYVGDGRFEDTHVGVVSWGEGCALPQKPGVYARTSSGSSWIKEVVCGDWSLPADFCDDADNDGDGDDDDDDGGDVNLDELWSLQEPYTTIQGQSELDYIGDDIDSIGLMTIFNGENVDQVLVKTWDGSWVENFYLPSPKQVNVGSKFQINCGSTWGVNIHYTNMDGTIIVKRLNKNEELLLILLEDDVEGSPAWFTKEDYVSNVGFTDGEDVCDQKLEIIVNTDIYGIETGITLTEQNGALILRRKYLLQFYINRHIVCLKSNTCYNFEVTDTYGDGMCTNSGGCGSFELKLNGETKLLNDNPNFGSRTSFEVCTNESDSDDNDNDNEVPTAAPVTNAPTTAPFDDTKAPFPAPFDESEAPFSNTNEPFDESNAPFQVVTFEPVVDQLVPISTDCEEGFSKFQVEILTDNYGGETYWDLTYSDSPDYLIAGSNRSYSEAFTDYTDPSMDEYFCLESGNYTFTMFDQYGDGVCCEFGEGHIIGILNDNEIFVGGNFSYKDTRNFTVTVSDDETFPTSSPTSEDDIPTGKPTVYPTFFPTGYPTDSNMPSDRPTNSPSNRPSDAPSDSPTKSPTLFPTFEPTNFPTEETTDAPSQSPTVSCIDSKGNVFKDKKCSWVGKGKNTKKITKKCNKKYKKVRVYDACPKTCGKKAGVGKCKFLFGTKNKNKTNKNTNKNKNN